GIKECRKLRLIGYAMEVVVEPFANFRGRDAGLGKRAQQCLDVGHEYCGRDSLAADVRDRKHHPPIGKTHHVIVVSADSASWNTHRGKLQSVFAWKEMGEERLLYL